MWVGGWGWGEGGIGIGVFVYVCVRVRVCFGVVGRMYVLDFTF
jgi:hypothetical protein